MPAKSEHPPGEVVGKYRVIRALGEGGGGRVYEAVHVDLKKRVALKFMSSALSNKPETTSRFLREGELATRIRHAHVVDITDFGIDQERPYLVMEFLEGEDLLTRLQRVGRLDVEDALELLVPLMAAVAAVHEEGVVHRDLKPANIFLARTRQGIIPKLLDFGISKLAGGADLTKTASMLGTPIYMSPEQIRDSKHVDPRTDQYALGVILYQLVTGRLPFEDMEVFALLHAIVSDPYPKPRELRPELPEALESAILRAMNREADFRFASVQAFAEALLPLASAATRAIWEPVFRVRPPSPPSPATLPERPSGVNSTLTSAPTQAVPDAKSLTSPRTTNGRAVLGWGAAAAVALAVAVVAVAIRKPRTEVTPPTPSAPTAPASPAPPPPSAQQSAATPPTSKPEATSAPPVITALAPSSVAAVPSTVTPIATTKKTAASATTSKAATPASSVVKGTNGATIIAD